VKFEKGHNYLISYQFQGYKNKLKADGFGDIHIMTKIKLRPEDGNEIKENIKNELLKSNVMDSTVVILNIFKF